MKKFVALVLALTMSVSMFACGSKDTTGDTADNGSATTENNGSTATTADGSVLSVCLASEPDTIDPALNSTVDGATMVAHLFSGLATWEQAEDGTLQIVADAAEELVEGVPNEDGTVTYTYTLRNGLT